MQTRLNKTTYWLRRRFGRARIIVNRRRSRIYFDRKKKKIVIGEQYEKKVRVASRVALLASILTSIFTLPPPYSIFLSLGLIFVEQAIERVIYSFQTLLIVPFPSFEVWEKAHFSNMIFAKYGRNDLHRVGMVFEDARHAKEVWSYIEDWNYGSDDDRATDNISVSIVINRKADAYALFVYPAYERPTVKAAKKQFQKGQGDKEQIMLVGQMIMCRVFSFNNSAFQNVFLPRYKDGDDYIFSCWYMGDPPEVVPGTMQIRKNRLKIIELPELTRKDMEYHMAKYSINWHNPDPDRPSLLYVRDP
jgi:hypothetical protein